MSSKLVLHNNYIITDKSVSEDYFGQFPKVVFVVDVSSFFYFFGYSIVRLPTGEFFLQLGSKYTPKSGKIGSFFVWDLEG